MSVETAFLAAIQSAPHEAAPRLVYADWLEERKDWRGELIRVEEEMRELPVYSDRFWQLKPRRNELRSQAAPDWLQTMRYGTDSQPLFSHGVPDGWKERWRLIREYVERWYQIPLPDVGGRTDEIIKAQFLLGRTLPASVREWVAFAHDVRRDRDHHVVLRDLYQMVELNGLSAVSLLLQCEGDYHWAVRHRDLAVPDPPVHGFHWDFENEPDEEESFAFVPDRANPIARTLTAWVLEYAMAYTRGGAGGFNTDVADATRLIHDLTTTFPVNCRFGKTEIFEADNIQVRLHPSGRGRQKSRRRIVVEVAKSMPREAVPAFLWDYTRSGGSFHGMFIPEGHRFPPDPPEGANLPF
jgi:uncharacterized protein (TIGR02996 family)